MEAFAYRDSKRPAYTAHARRSSPVRANPELRFHRASFPRALTLSTPLWRRDAVLSFSVLASLTLVFCVVALIGSLRYSKLPSILHDEFDDATYVSAYAPSDKDSFLMRLTAIDQRKVGAHAHYISEVIKDYSPKVVEADRIAYAVVLESRKLDLDPLFVAAVIKSESAFNRKAVSYAGASGLMQLMPATARYIAEQVDLTWHGNSRLHDPFYNIKLGTAYIKYLEVMFEGNRERMLIAYNWGPANLMQALKSHSRIPQSTKTYARTILGDHAKWRSDFTTRQPEFLFRNLAAMS